VERNLTLGVDIGGTHLICALVEMNTLDIIEGSTSRSAYNHTLPTDQLIKIWGNTIQNSLSNCKPNDKLQGIGFAMPGPFDYKNAISMMQQKMVSLYQKHIPTELKKVLPNSQNLKMRFINDASCFAIGESLKGAGQNLKNVVVITLGTGFGSAFIEKNLPIIDRADVPKEGCLWHLPFLSSIADDYFSTKWFLAFYEKLTSKKLSGVKELIEEGDAVVVSQVFDRFAQNLVQFIAPYLDAFKAEILIIGGNISKSLPHFIKPLQLGFAERNVWIEIEPSNLLEEAAIIGSAKLFDDSYWKRISKVLPNL